ncbi:MAG: AAA family ATPase, partial [Casimicrobium sp.]
MSTACMVIGESGSGKTTSLRNLKGEDVFLIQAVAKPLPFKSVGWKPWVKDDADSIIAAMRNEKMTKKIVVIDDWQYIMANEFMRRSNERGYDKFTDIAKHAWEILRTATSLKDDVRVYFLAHSDTDEQGKTRSKTIGKLLNEKITVEGLLTIVLRAQVVNGPHIFST